MRRLETATLLAATVTAVTAASGKWLHIPSLLHIIVHDPRRKELLK